MFCPNCGKENPDGVAFCAGCGMAFGSRPAPQPVAAPAPQPVAPPAPQPASYAPEPVVAAPVVSQPQPAPKQTYNAPTPPPPGPDAGTQSSSLSFGQHFKNLFKAAIHPVTGPAEIAGQYDRVGDAIFLAGIVVVVCWLVNFTSSMTIDLIHYAEYGRFYTDSIAKLIIKNDLIFPLIKYSIRIFGCAGVFMLAGLILREKWSFSRLLAISSMATACFVVSDLFGSFVGLIPKVGFGYIFTIAAYAYYLLMIFEGMGAETKLTGNKKGFVLVICIAVTGFAAHYF